jgi:predicted site-specific integrase-resolvase
MKINRFEEVGAPGSEGPTGDMVSMKEAIRRLGVTKPTLIGYVNKGELRAYKNRVNRRVYFDVDDLLKMYGRKISKNRRVLAYCRAARLQDQGSAGVSAEERLSKQIDRVQTYCAKAGIQIDEIITDVAGATQIDERSAGFNRLMEAVLTKQCGVLVVENFDRIGRWAAAGLVKRFLLWHGVEIVEIMPTWQLEEYRIEAKQDLADVLVEAKRLMGGGL